MIHFFQWKKLGIIKQSGISIVICCNSPKNKLRTLCTAFFLFSFLTSFLSTDESLSFCFHFLDYQFLFAYLCHLWYEELNPERNLVYKFTLRGCSDSWLFCRIKNSLHILRYMKTTEKLWYSSAWQLLILKKNSYGQLLPNFQKCTYFISKISVQSLLKLTVMNTNFLNVSLLNLSYFHSWHNSIKNAFPPWCCQFQ